MQTRIQTFRWQENDQSPNVHGWGQTLSKKWKRTGNSNTFIRIYRKNIGMEFGIEKCAMLVMKVADDIWLIGTTKSRLA